MYFFERQRRFVIQLYNKVIVAENFKFNHPSHIFFVILDHTLTFYFMNVNYNFKVLYHYSL